MDENADATRRNTRKSSGPSHCTSMWTVGSRNLKRGPEILFQPPLSIPTMMVATIPGIAKSSSSGRKLANTKYVFYIYTFLPLHRNSSYMRIDRYADDNRVKRGFRHIVMQSYLPTGLFLSCGIITNGGVGGHSHFNAQLYRFSFEKRRTMYAQIESLQKSNTPLFF